jgi:osmoprotectant transport system permease protein
MSAVWTAFQDNEGWLRVRQHAVLSAVPLLIALVIGIPLGILAGRLGRVGSFVVAGSAFVTRMVPTFAVMALVMALTSIGFWPAVVGLVLLGIPSILLNTATGIREADPHAIDAARGMGYTEPQVLSRLQLPLALPHVAAGLRTAAVLTVSTAALAGLIGADVSNNQDDVLLAGAIPVTAMALVADVLLIALQRLLTPVGLRRRSISSTTR